MKNFLSLLKSKNLCLRTLCFLFILNISTFQSQVDWISGSDVYGKIIVDSNWKFHEGDNLKWAQLDYEDKLWKNGDLTIDLSLKENNSFRGICWFRQTVIIDSIFVGKPLALILKHVGASEIYLNGKLIKSFGRIGSNSKNEQSFQPNEIPSGIVFNKAGKNLIAIRYSNHKFKINFKNYGVENAGLNKFKILGLDENINSILNSNNITIFIFSIFIGILFTLSFIHALLFIFYKKNKSNLYYSFFVFFYAILFTFINVSILTSNPQLELLFGLLNNFLYPLIFFFLITFLYSLFYEIFPKIFWLILTFCVLSLLFIFFKSDISTIFSVILMLLVIEESIRIIIKSVLQKRRGAKILGAGVLFFMLFLIGIVILVLFTGNLYIGSENSLLSLFLVLFLALSLLSIPISMSVFLAKNFSDVNKDLEEEKNNLEIRVADRTADLEAQKHLVEEKHKEITDSINYAKRIQSAILPSDKLIKSYFSDSFILYKPKDIVAGDFYWFEVVDDLIFFAAADCTGHGVPGALVSVVCHNALNRSVKEFSLTNPADILDKTREIVVSEFEKSDEDVKDGMDISLCVLDKDNLTLNWAGAHNPLWILRKNSIKSETEALEVADLVEILETKADKQPIGKFAHAKPFSSHKIQLFEKDEIYISTDGFQDQFGGEKGKKFKASQLKEILIVNSHKTMNEKLNLLDESFVNWKGDLEQVDDVCIIGVRI